MLRSKNCFKFLYIDYIVGQRGYYFKNYESASLFLMRKGQAWPKKVKN